MAQPGWNWLHLKTAKHLFMLRVWRRHQATVCLDTWYYFHLDHEGKLYWSRKRTLILGATWNIKFTSPQIFDYPSEVNNPMGKNGTHHKTKGPKSGKEPSATDYNYQTVATQWERQKLFSEQGEMDADTYKCFNENNNKDILAKWTQSKFH